MKRETNILLIDNDPIVANAILSFFNMKGFETNFCRNGADALKYFETHTVDFIISEADLPDMDGFSLGEKFKKYNVNIPLIYLTGKSSRADVSRGFEVGADDYVIKPFCIEELYERVRAVCRRTVFQKRQSHVYQLSTYSFDSIKQILEHDGKEIKLTRKEMDLLSLLCEHQNQVVDRSYALKKIWYNDDYFNARSMDVYITKLRKHLKKDPKIKLKNIHGVGYKLIIVE